MANDLKRGQVKTNLLESIGKNEIIDSIKNNYRIEINYQKKGGEIKKYLIRPFALGRHKGTGNTLLRAYLEKNTNKNKKPWRTFNINNILNWRPLTQNIFTSKGNEKINLQFNDIPSDYDSNDVSLNMIYKNNGNTTQQTIKTPNLVPKNNNNALPNKELNTPIINSKEFEKESSDLELKPDNKTNTDYYKNLVTIPDNVINTLKNIKNKYDINKVNKNIPGYRRNETLIKKRQITKNALNRILNDLYNNSKDSGLYQLSGSDEMLNWGKLTSFI